MSLSVSYEVAELSIIAYRLPLWLSPSSQDLFRSTLEPVEKILHRSKVDKANNVHEIALVKGSNSYSPYRQACLRERPEPHWFERDENRHKWSSLR